MSQVETVNSIAGKIGMAHRYGRPEIIEGLRGDLAVARIAKSVRDNLATAPPLTEAQKDALRSVVDEAVSA